MITIRDIKTDIMKLKDTKCKYLHTMREYTRNLAKIENIKCRYKYTCEGFLQECDTCANNTYFPPAPKKVKQTSRYEPRRYL